MERNQDASQTPAPPRLGPAWFWVLVITAIGLFFRAWHIGAPSFRADTYILWELARSPMSAGQIWSKWIDMMGMTGQFPLAPAVIKLFISTFGLQPTPAMVRLPSAFWGAATIPFVYLAAAAIGGRRMGFIAALLLALSPFHILTTREAYYYPPMICGTAMLFAAAMAAWSAGVRGDRLPRWFFPVFIGGFFLGTYAQPSGWALAGMLGVATIGALAWGAFKKRLPVWPVALSIAACVFMGLPLLWIEWAMPQMRKITTPEWREYGKRVFAGSSGLGELFFRLPTAFGFGGTPIRGALSFATLAAGLVAALACWKRERRGLLILGVIFIGVVLNIKAQSSIGAAYEPRYVVAYLPLYIAVIAWGFDAVAGLLARRSAKAGLATAAVALAGIAGFYAEPAWVCTELRGKPTPYRDIVVWMDEHLPAGTPVLTDRWFEPWNEFRIYHPQNVVMTFTVPDEPQDTFRQVNWRETARNFFERFPDAAFLEVARNYWNIADIGPWMWPRTNFVHKQTFTNAAGIRLRELGLANRGDYFAAATNRLLVDLYYNTREDVLGKWKAEGRGIGLWFGPGWRYEKSGPRQNIQTRDFMEWRALGAASAQLELHRLNGAADKAVLKVRGVSVGGLHSLTCAATGQRQDFPPGQMIEWTLGPVALTGDLTTIAVADSAWRADAAPLLIESVTIQP